MSDRETKARKHLPLSESTYYILTALAVPRHGYGIMQAVSVMSKGLVKLAPGTLYGALTKLLEQGMILRAGESAESDERRKTYALTDMGRKVVGLEVMRLASLVEVGHEALATIGEIE
jgi:DNA-binding PadR family transcriptional regulator